MFPSSEWKWDTTWKSEKKRRENEEKNLLVEDMPLTEGKQKKKKKENCYPVRGR